MTKTSDTKVNYQALNEELDTILNDLQSGTLDIDGALKAYARGQEIIDQLEKAITTAKNTVTKLKVPILESESPKVE